MSDYSNCKYKQMPVKLRSFIYYLYNCETYQIGCRRSIEHRKIRYSYNFGRKLFLLEVEKKSGDIFYFQHYLKLLDDPITFDIENMYMKRVLLLCDILGYDVTFQRCECEKSYIEVDSDHHRINIFLISSDISEYHHYLSKFRNYRRMI